MQLLILGYGKMGRTIAQLAESRGHIVSATIDENDENLWQPLDEKIIDVAIEFSQPDAAITNIRRCLKRGIPVISGTTGWLGHKPELDAYCQQQDGTFFYASNFSIGVNLFFRLNELLADMMNHYPEYQPSLEEIHHTEKKDAPSGTALTLLSGMLNALERKQEWILQEGSQSVTSDDQQLVVRSVREGQVPGTHVIRYQSDVDDIEIKHTAHSRQGFALGAVLVAEWLPGKKGVLGMNDFMPL